MKLRVLVVLAFCLLAVSAIAQTDNTLYVRSFKGTTVGDKVANAMKACNPNTAIPCILVIDPSLAVWAPGTMPGLCAQCSIADYRLGSVVPSLPGITSDGAGGLRTVGAGTFGIVAVVNGLLDANGFPATGINVTPWDQGFETLPQNYNPWGWDLINASTITQSTTQAYQGKASMAVTLTGNGGGANYPLGPLPTTQPVGQLYPTITTIPGRTYTLSGYYMTSGGAASFNNYLSFNASGLVALDGVVSSQTLPAASSWTFFSLSIVAPAMTAGKANYVWLGVGAAVPQIAYFDNLTITDGVAVQGTPQTNLYSGFTPRNAITNSVIDFHGDSITVGYPVTPSWTSAISTTPAATNGPTFTVYNDADGGDTTAQMIGSAWSTVDPHFSPNAQMNIVSVWGGTNDILLGVNNIVAYDNLVQYCRERHRLGWKVVISTLQSIGGYDTQRDALNLLIRNNWQTFSDGMIDIAATPSIGADGAYANATYFQADHVHMTAAGYAVVTGMVNTGLNYFINPGAEVQQLSTQQLQVGTSSLGNSALDQNLRLYYDTVNNRAVMQTNVLTPLLLNPAGGAVITNALNIGTAASPSTLMTAAIGNGGFAQETTNAVKTSGHCASFDAASNIVDSGITCAAIVPTITMTAQSANMATQTIATTTASTFGQYRLSCYVVLTRAATTSSVLPSCSVYYYDSDTGLLQAAYFGSSGIASNTVGNSNSTQGTPNANDITFYSQASKVIQVATVSYASVGATAMQYAVHFKLEYLGQ